MLCSPRLAFVFGRIVLSMLVCFPYRAPLCCLASYDVPLGTFRPVAIRISSDRLGFIAVRLSDSLHLVLLSGSVSALRESLNNHPVDYDLPELARDAVDNLYVFSIVHDVAPRSLMISLWHSTI